MPAVVAPEALCRGSLQLARHWQPHRLLEPLALLCRGPLSPVDTLSLAPHVYCPASVHAAAARTILGVRLEGGGRKGRGRLLVQLRHPTTGRPQWGTVSRNPFFEGGIIDQDVARVACRQLGYSGRQPGAPLGNHEMAGPSTLPVLLSAIYCQPGGGAASLNQCALAAAPAGKGTGSGRGASAEHKADLIVDCRA